MRIQPYAKLFFDCIGCEDHEFEVDHIMDGSHGPRFRWVCDNCGTANEIEVFADGSLGVERNPEHDRPRRLVLLRLDPGAEPVYIVSNYSVSDADSADEQRDNAIHYFEEHTCPTNPSIEEIIVGTDPDRHGLFQFVALMPVAATKEQLHTTHDIMRHIRNVAPELYAKTFAGSLPDDDAEADA